MFRKKFFETPSGRLTYPRIGGQLSNETEGFLSRIGVKAHSDLAAALPRGWG